MKTRTKITLIVVIVVSILFIPPNVAAFTCNTLEIKDLHCHVVGMSFFGVTFHTNIYDWFELTGSYPCGGVLAHPDKGYHCMGIADFWGLPPVLTPGVERERYDSEKLDVNTGLITDEGIKPVWISIPITSCGYPWHESNHEKTKQYYVEYRNVFGNYDSSDPQENAEAMHYIITRYYEDLGKDILDVNTSIDHSMDGTEDGCNTTVGGTWHLKIQTTDLSYFLNNGFIEQEEENEN